ncbi:MAG: aminoacyl-tRNA hydrolase [Pseudomonadota bacterium]
MLVFAGLGNPGEKYSQNRHNVGFRFIDRLAEQFAPPAGVKWRNRFNACILDVRIGGEAFVLVKPQTFMNNSGQAIGELMRYYKLSPSDLTVFYDELDVAPLKIKIKVGGGHGGHNGIKSIDAHVGTAYTRVRIGIGHPGSREKVMPYVLGDFGKAEARDFDTLIDDMVAEIKWLAAKDHARFLTALAARRKPNEKPVEDRSLKNVTNGK